MSSPKDPIKPDTSAEDPLDLDLPALALQQVPASFELPPELAGSDPLESAFGLPLTPANLELPSDEPESAAFVPAFDGDLQPTSANADRENTDTEPTTIIEGQLESLLAGIGSRIDAQSIPAPSRASLARPVFENTSQLMYLNFTLAGTRYAVPVSNVLEVSLVPRVTRLPHAPAWLRGVTNWRGDILSVVDLRLFLGLDPGEADPFLNRLLVVCSQQRELTTSLIVDHVNGFARLAERDIELVEELPHDPGDPFVRGGCEYQNHLLTILDLNHLLLSPEIRQFEPV